MHTCANYGVTDGDSATSLDVNAVGVGALAGGGDGDPADLDSDAVSDH